MRGFNLDAGVDIQQFTGEIDAKTGFYDLATDHIVRSPDDERSVVFRSFFSQRPLFLERSANAMRFELRGPDCLETCANHIDPEWLADYVAYQVPLTTRTYYRGLTNIRPGMHLQIDHRSGNVVFKFPDAKFIQNRLHSSEANERAIRCCLTNIITRCDPSKSVFHLSGGLDSSLLVLLATQIHGASKIRVVTFQARGRGASDELDIVRRLADELGISLTILDFREIDIWSSAQRMIGAYAVPVGHPSALARYLMDEAVVTADVEAIVTGRGADELFGGYAWHLPEFTGLAHHDRVRATRSALMRSLFPLWQREAERNYTDFFAESYDVERRSQYDMATLGGDWCFIDAQLARHFGVEVIAPFCDTELQAVAFNLPAQAKIMNGEQKVILRQLFKDVYPGYLLGQPKRGLSFDMSAYLRQYTAAEIARHLNIDWLHRAVGLSLPTLEQMLEQTLAGTANYAWQIWSIYLATLVGSGDGGRGGATQ